MQFLIDFINDVSTEEIESYFTANNISVISEFSSFEKCYYVECPTTPSLTSVIEKIEENKPNVISFHNYPITSGNTFPKLSFETHEENNWWKLASFNGANFDDVQQIRDRKGNTATIYLIDSGANLLHEEFQYASISNLFSFNGDATDYTGHGTNLASLMVGNTCGITDSTVKILKIYQPSVNTNTSDIIAAFDAVISDISTNSPTFPIVNLSWGIPPNQYVEDKIASMIAAGIVIVCSAGNSGTEIPDITPARMPGVVVVGAYNNNLTPSTFSNYTGASNNSPAISVWAPGEQINVAAALPNSFMIINGTSAAAAIMSAIIAYNSNVLVFSNGSVPDVLFEDNLIVEYSYGKDQLLTFSPPYDKSTKYVGTMITELDGQNGVNYATISSFNILATSGQVINKLAANPIIIDKFTIEQPLPANFSMDNGWLVGSRIVTEPFYWESPVTYTTHSSLLMHAMIRIAILPIGQTIENNTFDNSVDITFFAVCSMGSGPIYSCGGTCIGGKFCVNACGGYAPKVPEDFYCYCSPPSQSCP